MVDEILIRWLAGFHGQVKIWHCIYLMYLFQNEARRALQVLSIEIGLQLHELIKHRPRVYREVVVCVLMVLRMWHLLCGFLYCGYGTQRVLLCSNHLYIKRSGVK